MSEPPKIQVQGRWPGSGTPQPVLALFLHDAYGVGISLSFVIATAGSMIPAAILLMRSGSSIYHRPDWRSLRRLLPVAVSHNWLNLATAIPTATIPIIVPLAVGAAANSVFYDVWMISTLLFMVPVHLGTVLFALASASPEVMAEKLRFVLRISLLIGLPAMLVLAVAAHFALDLFGPGTPRWAPCRSGCASSATSRKCPGRSSSRFPARPTGSAGPPA